jgi:hypothetical protein
MNCAYFYSVTGGRLMDDLFGHWTAAGLAGRGDYEDRDPLEGVKNGKKQSTGLGLIDGKRN